MGSIRTFPHVKSTSCVTSKFLCILYNILATGVSLSFIIFFVFGSIFSAFVDGKIKAETSSRNQYKSSNHFETSICNQRLTHVKHQKLNHAIFNGVA